MPETEILIFAEANGNSPFLIWLDKQSPKVQDKCIVFIERLEEYGYDLRRPQADYLRDGIYSITPKNFVFLTKIFFKISRKAAKNAKKYIVLHFASFAALRENNIWLRLCCVRNYESKDKEQITEFFIFFMKIVL